MNYQDELKKMKSEHLKFLLDTITEAGIANETTGKWKEVFLSARNKCISPRVKAVLSVFSRLDNIETAIDAFMSVQPNFKRKNTGVTWQTNE